jgi:hypothetical protein
MLEEARKIEKIVLIFNADAGAWNALVDSTKKLFNVNGCSLCSITHGLFGEKDEWQSCKESIGVDVDYFHRDEVDPATADLVGDALPCVLAVTKSGSQVLMGPDVLSRCGNSVEDFKGRLHHHAVRLGLELD